MKKIITGLSLFLGLGLLVTATMAWVPGFGRGFGSGREFLSPALPILGEKQFHKVEALQEVFLKEIELLQHDLLTKRTELQILGVSSNPDSAAKKVKEKEILDLQTKLQEKASNLKFDIWKVLNPEQRAQLDSFCPPTRLRGRIVGTELNK
jgi:Spy/CpxP family protein refolding chaperone